MAVQPETSGGAKQRGFFTDPDRGTRAHERLVSATIDHLDALTGNVREWQKRELLEWTLHTPELEGLPLEAYERKDQQVKSLATYREEVRLVTGRDFLIGFVDLVITRATTLRMQYRYAGGKADPTNLPPAEPTPYAPLPDFTPRLTTPPAIKPLTLLDRLEAESVRKALESVAGGNPRVTIENDTVVIEYRERELYYAGLLARRLDEAREAITAVGYGHQALELRSPGASPWRELVTPTHEWRAIVEVKTGEPIIGEWIRQVKTYRETLTPRVDACWLIHSQPLTTGDVRRLNNEGIQAVDASGW